MRRRPSTCKPRGSLAVAALVAILCGFALHALDLRAQSSVIPSTAEATAEADAPPAPPPAADEAPAGAPNQVDVRPLNADEQIAARLERILKATAWLKTHAARSRELESGADLLKSN
jgi:hypothetical protein